METLPQLIKDCKVYQSQEGFLSSDWGKTDILNELYLETILQGLQYW